MEERNSKALYTTSHPMNIAFCINSLGLAGLGGTLSSLLRNCSAPSKLNLWFLCAGLSALKKSKIEHLLSSEGYTGWYTFIDFDPFSHFGSFSSLHGDWTTYGRLLLPELVPEDKVLYLDADLIVEVDVLTIETFKFGEAILAAVGGGYFKFTLGNQFYINQVGMSPETEYFNAGVLYLNLAKWRVNRVKEKCLDIAKQFALELPSHDQSLLNIYCAGNFAKLPPAFNCAWLASQPKPDAYDYMIFHFVGSPKPWDPLGGLIHNGYSTWKKYSSTKWMAGYDQFTLSNLKRAWQIRRSYLRYINNKIMSNK